MSQIASNGVAWRALHAWSDAQCERLAAYWCSQLAGFVATWSSRPVGNVDVQVAPMPSSPSVSGEEAGDVLALYASQSVDASAWLSGHTVSGARTPVRAMAAALFGHSPGATAPASTGVACDALDALVRSFGFERFAQHSEVPMVALRQPWSGSLRLTFSLGASRWTMVATAPAVARWIVGAGAGTGAEAVNGAPAFDHRAQGELASLGDALARARVSLRVRIDGPQLALGALTDLREGDIVVLPHALSTPLHVETPTGEPVCRGYLGQHGEKFAVELSGAHSQSSLQESV